MSETINRELALWCRGFLKILPMVLLGSILALSGCATKPAFELIPAPLSVDPTMADPDNSIIWAEFNGDSVHGGGGQECCTLLPEPWQPGSVATIKWQKDPKPFDPDMPPSGTKAYREAYAKHAANYQNHEVTIPIPYYKDSCAVLLVFLPCNQVRPVIDCDEKLQYRKMYDRTDAERMKFLGVNPVCPKP